MKTLVILFISGLSFSVFAEDMARLESDSLQTQALPCPTLTTILPIPELQEKEGSSSCIMGSRIVHPLVRWPYTEFLRPAYFHDVRERFVKYLCESDTRELKSQAECLTSLVVDSPKMTPALIAQLQSDYRRLDSAKILGPDQRTRMAYLSAVLREKLPLAQK